MSLSIQKFNQEFQNQTHVGKKENFQKFSSDKTLLAIQAVDSANTQVVSYQNQPSTFLKVNTYIQGVGFSLLMATAINNGIEYSKVCLYDYMPQSFIKFAPYIAYPCLLIDSYLPIQNNLFKECVTGPICEELQCRLLFQEIFLKKIPKVILNKISPNWVSLVDSKVAKIARILLSSALFTLPHYLVPENYVKDLDTYKIACNHSNKLFTIFYLGIVLGSIQELTGNIGYSIFYHMLSNALFVSRKLYD